jgi:hypothetical protein
MQTHYEYTYKLCTKYIFKSEFTEQFDGVKI